MAPELALRATPCFIGVCAFGAMWDCSGAGRAGVPASTAPGAVVPVCTALARIGRRSGAHAGFELGGRVASLCRNRATP
ncbi:hypothetical protein [Roseobacter sp.]|uniref:hypothetical protein n=1 Tax=Roseobacter sp. TaxID=1907202 RepID=UPI003859DCD7